MTGKYYEELTPGLLIEHSIRRTVSDYDNTLFSAITHNLAPLHLDEEYSKTTLYAGRIINSMFTLALVCGVTVGELTQGTTMGNLGFEQVKFPTPLFPGDTVKTRTEIVDRRESKKYPTGRHRHLQARRTQSEGRDRVRGNASGHDVEKAGVRRRAGG